MTTLQDDSLDNDMLPKSDFSNTVRGKHFRRAIEGMGVVILDPDVAASPIRRALTARCAF